jgi:hypothetical protein
LRLAIDCGLEVSDEDAWRLRRPAGFNSDLPTLQLAHKYGIGWTENTDWLLMGAKSGSVSKVSWLYTRKHYTLPEDVCEAAASSGNVDLLKWLKEKGRQFRTNTCNCAAEAGHVHVLQYLRAEGCEWDEHCFEAAVHGGRVSVLRWLQQHKCPWSTRRMCNLAALSGSIHMMQHARQLGGTLEARTMSCAALKDHLSMCQHLHAKQCPWDVEACAHAARYGHLEVLLWLREIGAPWNPNYVAEEAAAGGRMHILQCLHNEGCLTMWSY